MLIANSDFCILFRMQYGHEAIKIALSLYTFQTNPIESGIDQRSRQHRTSYSLDGRRLNLTYQVMQKQ